MLTEAQTMVRGTVMQGHMRTSGRPGLLSADRAGTATDAILTAARGAVPVDRAGNGSHSEIRHSTPPHAPADPRAP
jgi:hypothetical protein